MELFLRGSPALQEPLSHTFVDLRANVVFDPEMCNGFVDESGDAVRNRLQMGLCNVWPSLRLLMEEFCQKNVVVIPRELPASCLCVCLDMLSAAHSIDTKGKRTDRADPLLHL